MFTDVRLTARHCRRRRAPSALLLEGVFRGSNRLEMALYLEVPCVVCDGDLDQYLRMDVHHQVFVPCRHPISHPGTKPPRRYCTTHIEDGDATDGEDEEAVLHAHAGQRDVADCCRARRGTRVRYV